MQRALQMLIVSGVMCFLALAAPPAGALDLVKDGKSCAAIVVADDAGAYQKWAAQWLQEYIKKATGAQLEIVAESKAPAGVLVSVGHTRLAEKEGIKTDDLKYDGCKLVVKGPVLYLIGNDYVLPAGAPQEAAPNPNNKRPQGTVRAVTTFLEDVAGVRWYLPGPEGTIVPNVKDLSVADTLNKKFVPSLAYCSTGYDTPIANYANNGRYAVNYYLLGGDGTWALCLGDTNYYNEHPEYFAMNETGKRLRPVGQPMLCTSNRDVWKIMVEKFRKLFDEGYDGVELAHSDGWGPCLCPACQKEFGDGKIPASAEQPAERIWVMHKWIIDELAKSHPDKKVIVTVYGPTRYPSKRFECLPDNAMAEWCSCQPDDKYWIGKFKASGGVVDYYVCEEGCVPTGFVPAIGPQWFQTRAKMWRDSGVVGAYGGGRGICWGLGGPAYYAYAKLAADPDVNLDKLLTEYCNGIYGEAGNTMERFFRLLHSRSNTTLTRPGFVNGYPGEDAFSALYPPSVVNKLDQLLKKAEKTAKGERARGWLKTTCDSFDGLKTVADMFAAKRAYELQPTREMLQLVKDRVETFEQWRARLIAYSTDKAYINRWFPGYYGMCRNLVCDGDGTKWNYLYYRQAEVEKVLEKVVKGEKKVRGTGLGPQTVLEPITWDFDRMMAKIGRQQEEKVILLQRTTSRPGPDGALEPKAWTGVKGYVFEMYHAANSTVEQDKQTVARLLYDDERLYVRFECNEPRLDNMKLKSVGRDGNVYYQEEVELFLNPECSNRKFLHFMASPVKDAFYDERKGYIEDPVDPRYAIADISWNPEWTYTYSIDKDKKMWVVEMAVPFKSLGLTTPKPGAIWTGNIARCRRVDGGEELSCWVAEEFGNPEVFGEIVFGETPGK